MLVPLRGWSDPSHPPFYLTGQEDVEGNHRAFTTACCNAGDQCINGFCGQIIQ